MNALVLFAGKPSRSVNDQPHSLLVTRALHCGVSETLIGTALGKVSDCFLRLGAAYVVPDDSVCCLGAGLRSHGLCVHSERKWQRPGSAELLSKLKAFLFLTTANLPCFPFCAAVFLHPKSLLPF